MTPAFQAHDFEQAAQVLKGVSGNMHNARNGISAAEIKDATRIVLHWMRQSVRKDELERATWITDQLLPYLGQHAKPSPLLQTAKEAAKYFIQQGDGDAAAIWLQFAAIRLRNSQRADAALHVARKATAVTDRSGSLRRAGYCLLTEASCLTRTRRFFESFDAIRKARELVPLADDSLSLHAQADLECAKIYMAIENGEQARYHVDSGSQRFRFQSKFGHADPIMQGYLSEAYCLTGKHGHAYTAGLRSVTAFLYDGDLDSIRELGNAIQFLTERGMYGFEAEHDLAVGLAHVLFEGGFPSARAYDATRRAAATLYSFHLEHTALPYERYHNVLEILCKRDLEAERPN